jgi:hypothetical protein
MRHFLCIFFLFGCHTVVQAQSARTCRVLFLGAPDNAPETLHLFDGKASQEVELPSINFSPVYKLPGGALVLRMLPAPEADPTKVSPGAPSVAVAADVTDFYLLVSSDPANAVAPVKLEVIDATKFTKGQMLWFNLTANRLDGQIGSEKLALDGNSQAILNPPATKNEEYNVNISFSKPGDDQLQPFCETKWRHDPQVRNVFFVVTNEGARAPRVMGLRDQREPAKRAGKR